MMKYILAFGLLTLSLATAAQRTNNWYFGDDCGLDFTSGSPVSLSNSAMYAFEGTGSVSDAQGNLLFYTNGGPHNNNPTGVWNRNDVLMPNGDFSQTSGCLSSIQAALPVPDPNSADRYYLFTVDCIEHGLAGGLRYSIIDMSLDGGLGDVTVKDSLVEDSVLEGLTGVVDAAGTGYWIMTHKQGGNRFAAFHLTASGISGPVYSYVSPAAPLNNSGTIRISCNGTRLAFSSLTETWLYDFDDNTGQVSNAQNLGIPSFTACFSPSGRFLYVTESGGSAIVHQFDLQATNIPASLVNIYSGGFYQFGFIQLGPDGKIYLPKFSNTLGVINDPDLPGLACNYSNNGPVLSGQANFSLPNFLENWLGDCAIVNPKNVQELSAQEMIALYPNPAQSEVWVELAAEAWVRLLDVRGRVALDRTRLPQGRSRIDVSALARGMYFVQVENENGKRSVQKLIVE